MNDGEMINRIGGKRFIGEDGNKKTSTGNLVFISIFCLSVILNFYFIFFQGKGEKPAEEDKTVLREKTKEETPGQAATSGGKAAPLSTAMEGGFIDVDFPVLGRKQVKRLAFTINSSLSQTLCAAISKEDGCEILTAYMSRLLNWKLPGYSDMRNGDKIGLLIEGPKLEDDNNNILALNFQGSKAQGFETFYYKGPKWKYGSYFSEDGVEIFQRFRDEEAPIKDFSEITSLVGDFRGKRKGHSGVDFKAEAGSPVYSPFEGRVLRVNWNFKFNGDCIEIDHPREGIMAVYLHLGKVDVKPGQAVKAGQKIAESGNTGRSFAPHLHYELKDRNDQNKILNPFKFKFHNTYYKKIPADELSSFREHVEKVRQLMN